MTTIYRRAYTGKLKGVILDWAGTTVDYGCYAPAMVFVDLFKQRGVPVSMEEARGPMGMYKRDHIAAVIQTPAVAARWRQTYGRAPDDSDVQSIYDAFIPRQIEVITLYADLIPGVKKTIDAYRARGLKVGSCTGYTRPMMEALLPEVRKQGFEPDALVCPEEAGGGRPAPWMCFRNAAILNIYPMEALVKIGDTMVDIAEGLNAGMWTIGLAKTGNELGLNEAEIRALDANILVSKLSAAYQKFYEAGAHYVVDSLVDTLPILDHIESRLARGEKP